jgi:hypothetical protein
VPAQDRVIVKNRDYEVLEYDAESIEEALLSKHSQTAYITLSTHVEKEKEVCCIESVNYCKSPSIIKFLRLIDEGKVYLDFTLSLKNGKTKDHGFLWRIQGESLEDLYIWAETQDLLH